MSTTAAAVRTASGVMQRSSTGTIAVRTTTAISIRRSFTGSMSLKSDTPTEEIPRPRLTFALICLALFSRQFTSAMFAPLFPQQADMKCMDTATVGWVFGIFQITVVLFTPVSLWLVRKFGSRALLNVGNFIGVVSNLASGTFQFVPAGLPFASVVFASRILAACCLSMQMTVGYSLLPFLFKDNVSTVLSTLETIVGAAFMIAPVAGAWMFTIGGGAEGIGMGFVVPWVVMSIWQFTVGLVMLVLLPTMPTPPEEPVQLTKFSPLVLVPVSILMASGAAYEFLSPTLEPYLSGMPFSFSVETVGLVYTVLSLVYTAVCPITGWFDDYSGGRASFPIMAAGLAVTGVGYLILAPAAWITSWTALFASPDAVWTSMILIGVGISLALIPTYNAIYLLSTHDDEVESAAATSALYNAAYGVGAFVGPIFGGALGEAVGVPSSYSAWGAFCIAVAVIVLPLSQIVFRGRKSAETKTTEEEGADADNVC